MRYESFEILCIRTRFNRNGASLLTYGRGFKALKQQIKLLLSLGQYDDALNEYAHLLLCTEKSFLSFNYVYVLFIYIQREVDQYHVRLCLNGVRDAIR